MVGLNKRGLRNERGLEENAMGKINLFYMVKQCFKRLNLVFLGQ